jgi:L-fucose mutarotase
LLKNLDPLLNAELLHALAAMGHGDELALVDRNYPAASTARRLASFSVEHCQRARPG